MDSIRGTAFLQFGELLSEEGASLREHLAPHRVDPEVVGNFDRKLSYRSLAQIFEGSAHAVRMPELGMELAARQGSSLLGPLQHLAHSAPTVGDGLVSVLRYMHIYSPSIHYRLERRPNRALLYFDNVLPRTEEIPQIVEKSVLQGKLLISELLGASFRPRTVLLRHQPQAAPEVYRRYFGCQVLFGQDHNALSLPPETLLRSCVQHDPALHAITRFYLEASSKAENDLQAKVEQHIQALLPRSRCNLQQVARSFGLHPRTLQRRLAGDGIDFEGYLEQIRRRQAEQMLCNTSLSVSQIARELGYCHTASFCRAHLRWFDMPPLELRRLRGNAVSRAAAAPED
ncbi:AraC family transcriptional regulator [Pseudomonas sp. ZM23]|uniref:AraC family transcriptional regulator ligand-binding domain-containing protein n=1 Tax=Pseudomonas triclosanedens TaxID=2961893 RepID=A0ABY7A815_9PSED|nr:AraC family transcriptional regulator [Pseudomonas triclosanedens]MCP8466298.1 AraC family transcriptional regulator [Pseudomonas triclosanedens]MCP8471824.1 AraC family transcriptional regulator [Pseudomonas triclosanedens]MCP8478519.1 AraC family transcriptional regulator [Pseudomonas triclosanedens]WAI52285.1 AraC family transcriptional regulator ligand-binding domain-containing protein [Pseudomonas triclosanedens]